MKRKDLILIKQQIYNDPSWKSLNNKCPWKTRSGCCGATKIECCKDLCAFAYWANKRK